MMDAQEDNLCLVNLPVLVVEKILSNIPNHTNVSRTCKYLYEIVCGMEKRRRVMYIGASDKKSCLNIDNDEVFESMMNSHRKIKEMELRVGRLDDKVFPSYELNEEQLERMTDIMKQFGENVTSLKFHGFELPINFILELLQQVPNLESLSFTYGKAMGSLPENATFSLQLPSLKALDIMQFPGILDIIDLIPAGSLNSIRYNDRSTEGLVTILAKQHNIKSLTLDSYSSTDGTALCFDHLQLDALVFMMCTFGSNIHLMDLLKCQKNLKELRFLACFTFGLSGSVFQWICNNLKKLEVFEVRRLNSAIEVNSLEMLGELKQLRHFRTSYGNLLFNNGFQSSQLKSDSMETFEIGSEPVFRCDELLIKVVDSVARNLPNVTHLTMNFVDFSALCFVLSQCTKIIHLNSHINYPNPDQLTQQRIPSIETLKLYLENLIGGKRHEKMNQTMTSIVRAMPNLKSVSMRSGLKFDVKTLKEFVQETKSLEYFYVDRFELNGELSTDDVVETIRCLLEQLKGYRIMFSPSGSREERYIYDLNWRKIKAILTNEFYVQGDCWKQSFWLKKDDE